MSIIRAAKAHFGWVSPKMIDRYYHGNVATLKVVAAAIEHRSTSARRVADILKKHHAKGA